MDIKTRLVNYYKNNEFIQKYIKGLDSSTNEIVLAYNDLSRNISIDELENITDEQSIISFLNNTNLKEEPTIDMVEPKVISDELNRETLNDIKILTEIKSKSGLDNILKDFAINEVIKSINEKYDFDLDLQKYDKTGKYLGVPSMTNRLDDEKIMSSFNNIKVYLEAASMYVDQVNFTEEDINKKMKEYIDKVKSILNTVKEEPKPIVQNVETEQVPTTQSAGFADIFVLCLILLVYAIIIVNLILKLA